MVDPAPPLGSTLETYGFHALRHRPQRPPDMDDSVGDEKKVPARAEKLQRRESRLGLRNLFTRSTRNLKELKELKESKESKESKEKDKENETDAEKHPLHFVASPTATSHPSSSHSSTHSKDKHAGKRTSLTETGHWPSALNPARSEAPLPHPPAEAAAASPAPLQQLTNGAKPAVVRRQKSGTLPSLSSRPLRNATVPWQPPPLFQAYPQAVKYMHLRASTISGDSILRLSEKYEKKGASSLRDDLNQLSPVIPPPLDELSSDKEKARRKNHQRNQPSTVDRLDWTTKIYVLVTSGFLLQYAGAGPFDRLPEKILSLSRDSAAFASDVIPGKHWVLHVASHMDPDACVSHDAPATTSSRSLFSRLRGADRRHASNFLMVFEDADDMEAWIVVLRKEIETLGGQRNLSETGRPKAEHCHSHSVDHGVRSKASNRTLVFRDSERLSRLLFQNLPWNSPSSPQQQQQKQQEFERGYERPDRGLDPERSANEQATDAMSTTNSFISHDGRQLESLRESGCNRLSFISSGQRTVVTSPGSSPSCSPTREAFPPLLQDEPRTPVKDIFPPTVYLPHPRPDEEVRMRPNAAKIHDRRQSLRAGNYPLIYEMTLMSRTPQSPATPFPELPTAMAPHQTTPNFSVPHSISRRYSFAKTPLIEQGAFPTCPALPVEEPKRLCKYKRRPSPPPLPLHPWSTSMVPDHAPPRPLGVARRRPSVSQQDLPMPDPISLRRRPSIEQPSIDSTSQLASPFLPPSTRRNASGGSGDSRMAPRKYASMHTLRTGSTSSTHLSLLPPFDMNPPEAHLAPVPRVPSSTLPKLPPSPNLLQLPALPPQLQTPEEIRRSRSSLSNRSEIRARSPSFPTTKRSFIRIAGCRKRASLQGMSSDGAINTPMVMMADALGVMMPAGQVQSIISSHARSASVDMHHQLRLAPGLMNRRSMPQLTEGPPPAPPPTCALPPIPQKSTLDV